jgi:aryl-phospho-beta-D-glucosidase BglC (GH1 family)
MVDEGGRPVRLRGVCVGGWMNMENFINGYPGHECTLRAAVDKVLGPEKGQFFFDRLLDYFLGEDDIKFMASLGANVLRVPMNYRHFEDDQEPFQYKDAAFKRLDWVIATCKKHGLYTILDLHSAQGWQNPDWHSDNPSPLALLWTHKSFQDRVAGLWQAIAARYKNEPAVAGYNILNEPVCGVKGAFPRVNALLAKAIRKVDKKHVLFVEGNWFSRDFSEMDPKLDPNTVFSSHNYTEAGFSVGPYPGKSNGVLYDRARMDQEFLWSNEFMMKYKVPTWVGEFGAIYRGTKFDQDRLRVVDDQIAGFDSHGVSWTLWTYKDIGMMGTAYVRPDSEWMRRTQRIRDLKSRLGCDTWGQLTKSAGPTTVLALGKAFYRDAQKANVKLEKDPFTFPFSQASRQIIGIFLSELIVDAYAEQFRDMTEKQIDKMMQSFAFKNCNIRQGLANVLKRHLTAQPEPSFAEGNGAGKPVPRKSKPSRKRAARQVSV